MRINAVYFCNVIDEHLARIAGVEYRFKDASIKSIISNYTDEEPATMGAQRSRLLDVAKNRRDEFALTFLTTGDWRNDTAAFGNAQELRNALAHGNAITQESVDRFNAAFPGYDFDVDGDFTLSPEMAAAFALIKPRRVVDDTALLPGFRALELAFCTRHTRDDHVFQSTAKYVIGCHLDGFTRDGATRRDCQRMWKINNIRNRYAHTGRITTAERAYCNAIATQYDVQFQF